MPGLLGNRVFTVNPDSCFVMMPFADSFNAIYRLIQRVCSEQGLACRRADEDVKPGKITSKIYDAVAEAGIVIADMSGRNANVFYEMGLAHAVCDNVILLTQSSEDVPFDLRDFMHIQYANTFEGAEKLASDLSKVLTTILRSADLEAARKRYLIAEGVPVELPTASEMLEAASSSNDESDLAMLHLRAEIARTDGDMNGAKSYLLRALEVAQQTEGEANEIGNCAIEAEKCGFLDLAEKLYVIAVDLDPTHVNNRQCYVSFLLDYRSDKSEALTKANELLDALEKTPERQERTRALRAQQLTAMTKGGGGAIALGAVIQGLFADGAVISINEAAPLLSALQRAQQFDRFAEVVERVRQTTPGDSQWKLDRAIADCYAASGIRDLRAKAINIYEDLLGQAKDTSAALKHNLATLLFSLDSSDADGRIGRLWHEAYTAEPGEMGIRKAYAQYLSRRKRTAEAGRVLAGKAIDGSQPDC